MFNVASVKGVTVVLIISIFFGVIIWIIAYEKTKAPNYLAIMLTQNMNADTWIPIFASTLLR